MAATHLIQCADLSDFFRSEVAQARDSLGMQLPDTTEYYVVNLLCEYSVPGGDIHRVGEQALALLYKDALEAPNGRQMRLLKHLGDLALYTCGFFAESIEKSLVDIDYYIAMGTNVYGRLADQCGGPGHSRTFADLYRQLARRFAGLVDLLAEIADRSRATEQESTALLRMYDHWARTGSERIQRLLVKKGLMPTPTGTDYIQ